MRRVSAPREQSALAWLAPIVLGGAAVAGFLGVNGWIGFPPAQRYHWMPFILASATALGVVNALVRRSRVVSALIMIIACVAAGGLFHAPSAEVNTLRWSAALAVASFMLWLALEPVAQRRPGPLLPLTITTVMCGAAIIFTANFLTCVVVSAAIACAALLLLLLTLFVRTLSCAGGGTLFFAAALPTILMTAQLWTSYAGIPKHAYLLVLIAPVGIWIGELPPLRRITGWRQAVAATLPVIMVVAAAVFIARWANAPG